MSLFLIKIGKAFAAIKRDGVFRASGRIWQGIKTALRPVGSGDILFISGGVGDSALYRTTHVAEELSLNGFRCSVTVQDNPFLDRYVTRFSVFIFHRTLYTDRIRKMMENIQQQGKEIIFETDDLVYDPQYLMHMDYYKKMNALERKLYDNGVGGEILRDPYVKTATTTTSFLANKLRDEGKHVFVVPNKLSQKDLQDAHHALQTVRENEKSVSQNDALKKRSEIMKNGGCLLIKKHVIPNPAYRPGRSFQDLLGNSHEIPDLVRNDNDIVRLGYFSGTISHNKDFATIADVLMQIMEKYSYVQLLLVGPLDVDNALVLKYQDRITQLPYVPRSQHFANIAQCDINLAPLELDNPFCAAKSELKFFEAGIVKVPTVAVANQTFEEAISDGEDGFVAHDTDEWVKKLSYLIESADLCRRMGEKAYDTSMRRYTTKNAKNMAYYAYLRKYLRRGK